MGFDDLVEWVARVPLKTNKQHPQLEFKSEAFYQRYESMLATMEYVRLKTKIPVPRVHHYDLTSENILCRPYILMDYLPGKPLSSCFDDLTQPKLRNIVKRWAEYTMELSKHQFPEIGSLFKEENNFVIKKLLPNEVTHLYDHRGPFRSVADYLFSMSAIKKHAIASQNTNPHRYQDFLRSTLLESLIPMFILPEHLNGPFVLSHRMFDMNSILVDTNYGTITGVLSWQRAAILPLACHIRVPDSLNYDLAAPEYQLKEPAKVKFSTRYRTFFEKCLCDAGKGSGWDCENLIERSLIWDLFERAICNLADEKYFDALWQYVYGPKAESCELTRKAMEYAHWGVAMADRWGIAVEGED